MVILAWIFVCCYRQGAMQEVAAGLGDHQKQGGDEENLHSAIPAAAKVCLSHRA